MPHLWKRREKDLQVIEENNNCTMDCQFYEFNYFNDN